MGSEKLDQFHGHLEVRCIAAADMLDLTSPVLIAKRLQWLGPQAQQDLLGRINDLEVLIDRVRGVQETIPMSDRAGMSQLDGLVRALEGECREGHAAYLRARPATLRLCDSVIEALVQDRPTAVA